MYIDSLMTIEQFLIQISQIKPNVGSKKILISSEFYDLENDPYEDNNIADRDKKIVEEMEDTLKKIINGFSLEKGCRLEDVDDDLGTEEINMVEKELKKMGYV